MKIDIEELVEQEEQFAAKLREADDRCLERLRARVFPTPSPFGIDWEKQRLISRPATWWFVGREAGRRVDITCGNSSRRRSGSSWLSCA